VEVDEETRNWERLDFARLKISIPVSDKAETSLGVNINGIVYWVTLEEKHFDTDPSLCRKWCSEDIYSGSNSFLVSKVDDTENLYEDQVCYEDEAEAVNLEVQNTEIMKGSIVPDSDDQKYDLTHALGQ